MKHVLISCLLLLPWLGNAATTTPAVLTWSTPATTGGTALKAVEISKHTVKCGMEPGKYTLEKDVAMPAVKVSMDFAARGRDGYRYCVVTATNGAGEESSPSPEIRFFALSGQVLADDPKRGLAAALAEDRP